MNETRMYTYARRALRRRFPKWDGWQILAQESYGTSRVDFVVERKRQGKIERVVVEVKSNCKISQKDVEQLNTYARAAAGKGVQVIEKILVVPDGADVSKVPEDIEIVRLKRFTC